MAGQLRLLQDIEEIKQLKARHCRLVDTKEWAAWGETCLTEDFHLNSDAGVQEGRDVVVSLVSAALADASTVHHVYTPEIILTGPDTATGVWAMEDWIRLTLDDTPIAFHGFGHYTEDYVRTDQGWRIKRTVQTRVRTDPIEVPDG